MPKANRKTGAKAPAKKSTQKKKKPVANALARIPASYVNQVCGLTDPFCVHANGAKWPDDSPVRTLTWLRRRIDPLATNVSGVGGILCWPNYWHPPVVGATVSVDGNMTWADSTSDPTIFNFVKSVRIVSAGFRLRSVGAPLYQSGVVHLRSWGVETGASFLTVNGLSFTASQAMSFRLADAKNVTVLYQHTSQRPEKFYDPTYLTPSNFVNQWNTAGFAPVTIFVSGAPVSQTVLEIEHFINYELIFDDGSSTSVLATSPPPYNPVVADAAKLVSSTMKTIFMSGVEQVGSYVVSAAANALRTRFPAGAVSAGLLLAG